MSALRATPLSVETDDQKPKVLLVEDDRMARMMNQSMLERLGYLVECAGNGVEAYTMLRENPRRADMVVSDRMMPILDGLALVRRLKREKATSMLPVILLTSASEVEDISSGIEAGAFYYLTKPVAEPVIDRVLKAAWSHVGRQLSIKTKLQSHQAAFTNMQMMQFVLSKPPEIEPVASLLASICGEPERVMPGLFELLQNGLEHGLMGLGFEEKQKLIMERRFDEEFARRAASLGPNKRVEASAVRKEGKITFLVKDSGKGFAWQKFLRPDPARAMAVCGRGIARASTVFSELKYNQQGNMAIAVVEEGKDEIW